MIDPAALQFGQCLMNVLIENRPTTLHRKMEYHRAPIATPHPLTTK